MAISSSHYWAKWDPSAQAPNIIRRDTRLYWRPQRKGTVGRSIGAFVGENPGSAESIFGLGFAGYSPIWQKRKPGDPTLRLLLEVWRSSITQGLPEPKPTDYIEILNTYYFRNATSGASLPLWQAASPCPYRQHPASSCRFILLGWGVGHTTSQEARAFVSNLQPFSRIIVPTDGKGNVNVFSGNQLNCPVVPGPVAPSYVLRRSKQMPFYIASVARELR